MLSDNSYILDKIIESVILTVVFQLIMKYTHRINLDYRHFAVIMLSSLAVLVGIDMLMGKVGFGGLVQTQAERVQAAQVQQAQQARQNGGIWTLPDAAPIMNESGVIETMDDPVAKLYYSQNRLPETINMEGLYRHQYQLNRKMCRSRPEFAKKAPRISRCLRTATLGQEKDLFKRGSRVESAYVHDNELRGGESQYQEQPPVQPVQPVQPVRPVRPVRPVQPQEQLPVHPEPPMGQHNLTFEERYRAHDRNRIICNTLPSDDRDASPWLFGTYNQNLNGRNFKAAPYCQDSPVIECELEADPMMCDNLEPKCAIGDPSCLPCDISELPQDYSQPLRDVVLKNNFYEECEKRVEKVASQKPVPCTRQSVIQPHYISGFPKYRKVSRKNLAILNNNEE